METIRKCKQCKENIVLETDDFLIYKESYYHFNCFIVFLTSKKRGAVSEDIARGQAEQLREESKSKGREVIAKNHLYRWIQRNYDMVSLPTFFYQKMEDIFNGNWKDMTEGISPEDLLEMWIRKKQDLDKIAGYNKGVGKALKDVARINYDLAVLINKYGSYKRWKENQVLVDQKRKETIEEIKNKVDYSNVEHALRNKKEEISICDLLDEI
jgi:hypothetical protein